nr:unnamed protein product [Digitaria exilis]
MSAAAFLIRGSAVFLASLSTKLPCLLLPSLRDVEAGSHGAAGWLSCRPTGNNERALLGAREAAGEADGGDVGRAYAFRPKPSGLLRSYPADADHENVSLAAATIGARRDGETDLARPRLPRTFAGAPPDASPSVSFLGCPPARAVAGEQRRDGNGVPLSETAATQLVRLESQKTVLTVSESTFRLQYDLYESSHQAQGGLGPQRNPSSSWHSAHAFRGHLSCPTPEKRKT